MLNKKLLEQNQEIYLNSLEKRLQENNIKEFHQLNKNFKEASLNYETLRSEQKKIKEKNIQLKENVMKAEKLQKEASEKLRVWLLSQPNILNDDVHKGDESNNKVIFESEFEKNPNSIHHHEFIQNLVMQKEAAQVSGARFIIFKKELTKLKQCLISIMTEMNEEEGYEAYTIPYIVNEESLYGTGQLPKFYEEAFSATNGQWLISTAEISLVNMFANKIFSLKELPKLCMSVSPCFRSEAGSAGKDTKGLIRLHQFHKCELVTICLAQDAEKLHQKKLNAAKQILNILKLPYKVLLLSGADTGFSAAKQYDIEVWMPGMNKYVEIASCSQCNDFQARRANIKVKNNNQTEFVHTLNGSSLPCERLIAAIIENYYDKATDKVILPDILAKKLKAKYLTKNGFE